MDDKWPAPETLPHDSDHELPALQDVDSQHDLPIQPAASKPERKCPRTWRRAWPPPRKSAGVFNRRVGRELLERLEKAGTKIELLKGFAERTAFCCKDTTDIERSLIAERSRGRERESTLVAELIYIDQAIDVAKATFQRYNLAQCEVGLFPGPVSELPFSLPSAAALEPPRTSRPASPWDLAPQMFCNGFLCPSQQPSPEAAMEHASKLQEVAESRRMAIQRWKQELCMQRRQVRKHLSDVIGRTRNSSSDNAHVPSTPSNATCLQGAEYPTRGHDVGVLAKHLSAAAMGANASLWLVEEERRTEAVRQEREGASMELADEESMAADTWQRLHWARSLDQAIEGSIDELNVVIAQLYHGVDNGFVWVGRRADASPDLQQIIEGEGGDGDSETDFPGNRPDMLSKLLRHRDFRKGYVLELHRQYGERSQEVSDMKDKRDISWETALKKKTKENVANVCKLKCFQSIARKLANMSILEIEVLVNWGKYIDDGKAHLLDKLGCDEAPCRQDTLRRAQTELEEYISGSQTTLEEVAAKTAVNEIVSSVIYSADGKAGNFEQDADVGFAPTPEKWAKEILSTLEDLKAHDADWAMARQNSTSSASRHLLELFHPHPSSGTHVAHVDGARALFSLAAAQLALRGLGRDLRGLSSLPSAKLWRNPC